MEFILVPVDFSACSKKAIEYAVNIAVKFCWNIELLHILEPDISVNPRQSYPTDTVSRSETAEQHLKMIQEALVKELSDNNTIEINYRLEYGLANDTIKTISDEDECSLVVMGSHGSAQSTNIFGSLAVNMIQRTETTLILVPETIDQFDITNIMFATNFLFKDELLIGELIALAKVFKAKVQCLHISSGKAINDEITAMRELKTQFIEADNEVEISFEIKAFEGQNLVKELFNYVEEIDANLIAMHTMYRSNFFEKILQPSLSKKVASKSNIPLLIFTN